MKIVSLWFLLQIPLSTWSCPYLDNALAPISYPDLSPDLVPTLVSASVQAYVSALPPGLLLFKDNVYVPVSTLA